MEGTVRRGLVSGAAGVTALNLVTYVDIALRGRPASDTPQRTVEAALDVAGIDVPGDKAQRRQRGNALGALAGIGTGLGIGVAASMARQVGVRLPGPVAAVVTGAAAMAASDVSATALGVADPRRWSASSWAADVTPHLAYGIATQATQRALERDVDIPAQQRTRPSFGLLTRSAAIGVASGARASLGFAAALLTRQRPGVLGGAAAAVMVGVELVGDKLPTTPSRLEGPGVPIRMLSGATGAVSLAAQDDATAGLPALAATVGAVAGSVGGAWWRDASSEHMPGWQAAVIEDLAALGLTWLACRGALGSS